MSKRALRRHHLARMKAKARKALPHHPNAEQFANHLKMCSCHMCGNPRKWWNAKTLQELKAETA